MPKSLAETNWKKTDSSSPWQWLSQWKVIDCLLSLSQLYLPLYKSLLLPLSNGDLRASCHNCRTQISLLLVPNKSIFSGEISGSLFVSGQKSLLLNTNKNIYTGGGRWFLLLHCLNLKTKLLSSVGWNVATTEYYLRGVRNHPLFFKILLPSNIWIFLQRAQMIFLPSHIHLKCTDSGKKWNYWPIWKKV